ncbi:unnamed protein product [Sphagnum balticum]
MKFGKRLQSQIQETLPEWRDKFLSYKQLKKRLKLIAAPDCFTDAAFDASPSPPPLEIEFVRLLNNELRKFNMFFIEKEEEYVIRLQELKDRIERVKKQRGTNYDDPLQSVGDDEVLRVFRDIVTFHGEMVLLENYSSLNYTGLVKILKKHDKRTGAVLRMPYIQSVLLQPFYTTELLSKLVQECERNLESLFSVSLETSTLLKQGDSHPGSPFDILHQSQGSSCEAVETIYRSTVTALRTIQDIRQGSSTQSIFSMPPMGPVENKNHKKAVINETTTTAVAVIQ